MEKWPISDEMRPYAVQVLRHEMEHAPEPRDRLRAVQVLATLEGQNMQAKGEGQTPTHLHLHGLAEVVRQAGRRLLNLDKESEVIEGPPLHP